MAQYQLNPAPHLGAPALIAIVAGIGSYLLSCSGHWGWGFAAAIAGMIFGILGFFWSALPGVRGGIISLLAIVLSLIALVPALLVMLGRVATQH